MTIEEAIYRLKNTAWLGSDADRVATEEAVQMAIEALEENESLAKSVNDAAELIRKLQKTGKWIHDGKDFPQGNDWIHCSVCGKRGINVPADLTNYCPNCGAKMEEEQ